MSIEQVCEFTKIYKKNQFFRMFGFSILVMNLCLNIIMFSVIMLSVIVLSVVAPQLAIQPTKFIFYWVVKSDEL
jgi:hypothetical protein